MNKPTCNWCEVEISPVVLGLYPDGCFIRIANA